MTDAMIWQIVVQVAGSVAGTLIGVGAVLLVPKETRTVAGFMVGAGLSIVILFVSLILS